MTSPTNLLAAWGFPVKRFGLTASVRAFQAGYAGLPRPTTLTVDGLVGPLTLAALNESQGHASPHFTWAELACKCGGKYPSCRRIWVDRDLVVALEKLRAACYPGGLALRSVCRCKDHNAAVGGASDSQHLDGNAADVPGTVLTASVRRLGVFNGIGYSPSSGHVVHVDTRPHPVAPFPDGN